jgi:glycosyltransferase involved in cell wall biosynthesis
MTARKRGILNLFYEEPDPDRWVPFDRYPRRVIRRLVRGPGRIGGTMRVFVNLCVGLDRLGVRYRINDYRHMRRTPHELACVVGKPHVLAKIPRETPILFGTAGYTHPLDDLDVMARHNIRCYLVPSLWVQELHETHWPAMTRVWPCGIDTELWSPDPSIAKSVDVVVYDKTNDKVGMERGQSLVSCVGAGLQARGLQFEVVKYGSYHEQDFRCLLRQCRSLIYLSAFESQGFALLQTLATDVPVLAWDRGGYWQDPNYYPHRVLFGPVTSVPYWDDRCGDKFVGAADFEEKFDLFWSKVLERRLQPRKLITETLTLEQRARAYLDIVDAVTHQLQPVGGMAQ